MKLNLILLNILAISLLACGEDPLKKVEETETTTSRQEDAYDGGLGQQQGATDVTAQGTYQLTIDLALFINNNQDYCDAFGQGMSVEDCKTEFSQFEVEIQNLLDNEELPTTKWQMALRVEQDAEQNITGVGCALQTESGSMLEGVYGSENQICLISLEPKYDYNLYNSSSLLLPSFAHVVLELATLKVYAVDIQTENYAVLGTLEEVSQEQ
jgi:hypothetical protein